MAKSESESSSSTSSSGSDSDTSSSNDERKVKRNPTDTSATSIEETSSKKAERKFTDKRPKKNRNNSSSSETSSKKAERKFTDNRPKKNGNNTSSSETSTSSSSSSSSSNSEDEQNVSKTVKPQIEQQIVEQSTETDKILVEEVKEQKEPPEKDDIVSVKEPAEKTMPEAEPVAEPERGTSPQLAQKAEAESLDVASSQENPEKELETKTVNEAPSTEPTINESAPASEELAKPPDISKPISSEELPSEAPQNDGEPETKRKKLDTNTQPEKSSPLQDVSKDATDISRAKETSKRRSKERSRSPHKRDRRHSRDRDNRSHRQRSRSRSRNRRGRSRTRSRSKGRNRNKSTDRRREKSPQKWDNKNKEQANPNEKISERQRRTVDLLTSRTGGAYIPPAKLRMMQAEITDKASAAYQRIAWEALKKSIHGYINKVNVDNIGIITRELLKENIVRGRGLLCRSIIQAQAASPTFTHVYAALVAIINSKFPNIGELLLKRLVIQFKRAFRRNDKAICLSASRFVAHLVNQRVAHEILALEILTLLVETPTDDSVEVAIAFLKECGMKLTEVSSKGIGAIFEMLKNILHEGKLDKRVQYMIEVVFQVRKDGFKDHQSVIEALELVEEDDQFTHLLMLDEATTTEDNLNAFKFDDKYETNEDKYKGLSKEILGSDASDSEEDGSGSGSDESDSEEDEEEKAKADAIIDNTETNLIALRRTIYLTINSSLDYEECAHKLMKMQLKPGQEIELCHMFLDCCAEQRTYEKFYGLLAQRFCSINKTYIEPFEEIFRDTYQTTHRLDTNRLRNVSKFFAHLLFTDAISWDVMECIKLNEDDTTSSSRIFIKILFQELAEYMGLSKLNQKLKDEVLTESLAGLFPKDNPRNSRFSINFFTSIGLGGLTDDLRQFLKNAPKNVPAINSELLTLVVNGDSSSAPSSSSSSTSSSSDTSSESSSSEEEKRKKKKKKNIIKKKVDEKSKKKKSKPEPKKKKSKAKKKPETSSSESESESDSTDSSSSSSRSSSSSNTSDSSDEGDKKKKSKSIKGKVKDRKTKDKSKVLPNEEERLKLARYMKKRNIDTGERENERTLRRAEAYGNGHGNANKKRHNDEIPSRDRNNRRDKRIERSPNRDSRHQDKHIHRSKGKSRNGSKERG